MKSLLAVNNVVPSHLFITVRVRLGYIEASALGVPDERIEGGAFAFRTAAATVHELGPDPAPSLDVLPKLLELVLWLRSHHMNRA